MYPIVFFHVPKAAGTSVRHYLLEAHPGRSHIQLERNSTWEEMPSEELASYEIVTGHLGWRITSRLRHGTRIAFLRDPFERALSMYLYWKNNLRQTQPFMSSFRSFLRAAGSNPEIGSVLKNGQTWQFFHDWPLDDRGSAGSPSDAELLEGALANLGTFHFVGFQDTLDTDLVAMASKLGWPSPGRSFRANATLSKPQRVTFHPDAHDMVRELSSLDYALLRRIRSE